MSDHQLGPARWLLVAGLLLAGSGLGTGSAREVGRGKPRSRSSVGTASPPSAVSTRCLLGRLQGRCLRAVTRVLVVLSEPCPGTREDTMWEETPVHSPSPPLGHLCVSVHQPDESRSTDRGTPVRATFRDQQMDSLGLGAHSRVRVSVSPNPLHGWGQHDWTLARTGIVQQCCSDWANPHHQGSQGLRRPTGSHSWTLATRASGRDPHWHPGAPSGRSSQALSSSQQLASAGLWDQMPL